MLKYKSMYISTIGMVLMNKIYLARQKIMNISGKIFAYELLFRDSKEGIKEFPTHLKATSQVLLNALTHMDFDKVVGSAGVAFINFDHKVLESGIVEILDPEKFVIEILETTEVTPLLVKQLQKYHKRGYKIALDDFDCTVEMSRKFAPLWKYIHLVKIDIRTSRPEDVEKAIPKFKQMGMKLLAEKVETKEELSRCVELGFNLFQGYHLHEPETLEYNKLKEPNHLIILKLVNIIRQDEETAKIERYIKKRPDLAFNLIKFINNQPEITAHVESITQVITLMGRERLLRWLLIFLYAEVSNNEISKALLVAALGRAENMEEHMDTSAQKEKAFMTGMFSMLDMLFEADLEEVLKGVKIDTEVRNAIVNKSGPFGKLLKQAQIREREIIKDIYMENFDRLYMGDLLQVLDKNGIELE